MDASYMAHSELYTHDYLPHLKDMDQLKEDYFKVKELFERIRLGMLHLDEHQDFLLKKNFSLIRAQFGSYKVEEHAEVFLGNLPLDVDTPDFMNVTNFEQLSQREKDLVEAEQAQDAIPLLVIRNNLQVLEIIFRKYHLKKFHLTERQITAVKKSISRYKKVLAYDGLQPDQEDIFGDPEQEEPDQGEDTPCMQAPRGSFAESFVSPCLSRQSVTEPENFQNDPPDVELALRLALERLAISTK